MIDGNRVRAELRERISTFSDLSREQQDALVESRLNDQAGNPRPMTKIRFYQRNIDDPNSQQFLDDEPEAPTPQAPPPTGPLRRNSFRHIGDLPEQNGDGAAAAPTQPQQHPNYDEANITTVPVLTEEEARAKLTQSILDRDLIRQQLDHANTRYYDALDRVEKCEFELISFKAVSQQVLQHDIEAFNAGLDPLMSLPKPESRKRSTTPESNSKRRPNT